MNPCRKLFVAIIFVILLAAFVGVQSSVGQCYIIPSPDNNEERIFAQSACAGVHNNPTNPTVFTIDQTRTITKIGTYHWNNGKGTQTPGTIRLQGQNGKIYGPWQASGQPGQGGVPNAYWIVTLTAGLDLPAGTYTVLDSDPSTWAYNSETGNSGAVSIVGQNLGSTKSSGSKLSGSGRQAQPETGSTAVPLASIVPVKPTVITSPCESVSGLVTLEEGGEVSNAGATLSVPPGAVSKDTEVMVRRLTGKPPAGEVPESVAGSAVVVSDTFDFRPDGIKFNKPVRITLPYREDLLPNGADETKILFGYFDGSGWRATAGLIDTEKNTASIQVNEFHGFLAELILGAVIAGAYYVAGEKIAGHIKGDLITNGKANESVTPTDPVVLAYSKRAILKGVNTGEELNLNDPKLGEMLGRNNGEAVLIYVNEKGERSQQRYPKNVESGDFGEIKPKDYLTTRNYEGDCVDMTNVGVSLFLANGVPAKGVGGYIKYQGDPDKHPHAWGEVVIANKVYLLDENGKIAPLEDAMKRMGLERPSTSDSRNRMWDDQGITKYDPEWFRKYLTTSANLETPSECPPGSICGWLQGRGEPSRKGQMK